VTNGVEPICRHQSIASANEGFFGVADPALPSRGLEEMALRLMSLISYRNYGSSLYRWPAEWCRTTVDHVPSTRHFDTVCAFFDVPLQVYEYPKMSDIRTHSGN